MKRALTLLLAALLLCLCSCVPLTEDGGSADSSAEVSVEESKEESVADEPSVDLTPSDELSVDEETAALCEEVRSLIELDSHVIDIFANGRLFQEVIYVSGGDSSEIVEITAPNLGEYVIVPEGNGYAFYSEITSLVESVYTADSSAIDGYLCNSGGYGPTVIRQSYDGRTEVCFVYSADYQIDPQNAKITYIGSDGEVYRFSYRDGTHSYTVCAAETENGLRLTDSLYFLELKRQSEQPYSKDTASERCGSCSTLEGNCLIINVFADDSDSAWTATAKAEAMDMLYEGLEFLKQSALDYGVDDLEFTYVDVDMRVGTDAMDYTIGGSYMLYAFEGTGYDGMADFVAAQSKGISYDNVCTIFHFNKHGRSYFVPCTEDYTANSDWYYEYGVLFYSKPGDGAYYSCASVYAHELLHAFGAKDLYAEAVTETGESLASLLFDCDIMRYEPTEISWCYIGPLTAKLIGWQNTLIDQLREVLYECLN